MKTAVADNVDAYIGALPPAVRAKLEQVRAAIRAAVPDAREKISYRIPTYTFHGNLIHFAGYAHHIGLYPGTAAIRAFAKDLARYESAKGSVQFPLDARLPVALVTRIAKYCARERLAKLKSPAKKRAAKPRPAKKK